MTLKNYNLVLVGCGNMGSALVEGAVSAGAFHPSNLIVIDRDVDKAAELATHLGCGGGDVVHGSSEPTIFVLATKPKDIEGAIAALPKKESDVFVSIAAGVRCETLREWIGEGPRIVRTMPNTPALFGVGITAVFSESGPVSVGVRQLFEACGEVVELERDDQFDAVTGLSGSGPAYLFLAIEALIEGGVEMGLTEDVSRRLAIQTVFGAATMARRSTKTPAVLRAEVTSPNGTTEAGLKTLAEGGFKEALIAAVKSASDRSEELGK